MSNNLKRKQESDSESDSEAPVKLLKTPKYYETGKRLIVILENASLETVKVKKSFELLNCDKHKHIILKNKREPGSCRPDITHQSLLMLFDSPLNRANLLQVYVHTTKNVLIQISPETRLPRTFDRFCGVMVQLLNRLSVRGKSSKGLSANHKLLKVIKGPVTDHLPPGCQIIGTSYACDDLVRPQDIVPPDSPVAVIIGAMAHGAIDDSYAERTVKISNYPLSAALTCSKICDAFETKWGIH